MDRLRMDRGLLLAACAAVWVSGGAFAEAVKTGVVNTLMIGTPVADSPAAGQVALPVHLRVHALKPSAISFHLDYDSGQFRFKSVAAGVSATAAGKDAEANEYARGSIAFLVWGPNSTLMEAGLVLTAVFEPISDNASPTDLFSGAGNLAMATWDGVSMRSQLLYFTPETVTASAGDPAGVLVEWTAVPGAAEYVVLRSTTDDPSTVEATSDSLPASVLSFLDDSDATIPSSAGECMHLYYWVAARSGNGLEGSMSEPALWNPGSPAAPKDVTVSPADSGGVLVQWSSVEDAAGYQVYRGVTPDPNAAGTVSGWLPASTASYVDNGVTGTPSGLGCLNVRRTYYYWVKARSKATCESVFGAAAAAERLHLAKAAPASVMPALGDLSLLALAGAGLLTMRRASHFRRFGS